MKIESDTYRGRMSSRKGEYPAHSEVSGGGGRERAASQVVRASSLRGREPKRAKPLSSENIDRVLAHIDRTSNSPHSDELKFVLSTHAGLRSAEIATLTIESLTNADGSISDNIVIHPRNSKNRKGRTIPMHPRIRAAVGRLLKAYPDVGRIAFSRSGRFIRPQNAHAVSYWFWSLYRRVGLDGCSSHSGRRTFITKLAQTANDHGTSLRDVQQLAGHSRLDTTASYIEASANVRSLVAGLDDPTPVPRPSTKSIRLITRNPKKGEIS